jgi:hypothetical protein
MRSIALLFCAAAREEKNANSSAMDRIGPP